MDLTKYTKSKKEEKKEILVDNDEVKIAKYNDEDIEFFFKNEDAISKYQNFLFFAPTHYIITDDEDQAKELFNQSIKEGVEGLMFKNLNSEYKPGHRSGVMAKIKETNENLDVVILGAEHGTGKRAGFYSSFIVAVKNEDYIDEDDKYLIIGKVASGLKELGNNDTSMDNLTNLLNPIKKYEENFTVWFEPKIVIEVKYQEIQQSTTYNSGFALRFPRIVTLRDDKSPEEINTIEDIKKFNQKFN